MQGQFAPGYLEKWEMSADALSWTLYVRKGIKFHNGDDLTAKDVKFSLERFMQSGSSQPFLRRATKSIEIVDDYTVRVYTNDVQIFYDTILSHQEGGGHGQVMPKDYFERVGAEGFQRRPVGSGPFKFVRRIPGDMVEYEALDKHWRTTPEFKKLTLVLMPEETTRVASLKTGEIDFSDIGLEAAVNLEQAGFRIVFEEERGPTIHLLGAFEDAAGPIGDIRVRQALSLAINRDEMRKTFFMGKAGPPAPPGIGELSDVNVPWWKEYAAKVYRYDPEEAQRLLKEAGYSQGFNIKINAASVAGAPYLPKMAEVVQGYWLKVGVKAEVVPGDYGSLRPLLSPLVSSKLIGSVFTFRHAGWSGGAKNAAKELSTPWHSTGYLALLGRAYPEVGETPLREGKWLRKSPR
ncbi:MAG: hypothetical protein HW402_1599 [Dehalococcoidales bacterium]|nr:hypothetical protein [Dehalococcoidales bacterium]